MPAGLALVIGALVTAFPAFWLARLHRAHRDFRTARTAVSRLRTARRGIALTFLKFSAVALAVMIGIVWAATVR